MEVPPYDLGIYTFLIFITIIGIRCLFMDFKKHFDRDREIKQLTTSLEKLKLAQEQHKRFLQVSLQDLDNTNAQIIANAWQGQALRPQRLVPRETPRVKLTQDTESASPPVPEDDAIPHRIRVVTVPIPARPERPRHCRSVEARRRRRNRHRLASIQRGLHSRATRENRQRPPERTPTTQ